MDVLETVQSLGIKGEVRGDEFIAPCPAHIDRTGNADANPSWSVNLDKGVFYCFSCNWKGSLRALVRHVLGEEGVQAWDGSVISTVPVPVQVTQAQQEIAEIPAHQYIAPMRHRGLPESVLSSFKTPPQEVLESRDVSAQACEEMGAMWDERAGVWALVVRNIYGDLLGCQFKSDSGPKVFRNWPTGMRKSDSLFGLHRADESLESGQRLAVVESPLDAVRLRDMGYPAVAIYGAQMSAVQTSILRHYQVLLVPDNDAAGNSMRAQAALDLTNMEWVKYHNHAKGIDPGDLSRPQLRRILNEDLDSILKRNIRRFDTSEY